MSNTIGLKIKDLRERAGMTQTDLADKIGVTKSVISAYEKGTRNPSHKVLESISNVFSVSLLSFYEKGRWSHESVTINITDLTTEQQKIIFSLVNEFRKYNQNK